MPSTFLLFLVELKEVLADMLYGRPVGLSERVALSLFQRGPPEADGQPTQVARDAIETAHFWVLA